MAPSPHPIDQRVAKALNYMAANLHAPLNMSLLSRHVGVSASHLRRLFRRETGSSPAAQLKRLRLHRAEELLYATVLCVKEVAAESGFGDVSHFVKDFYRHFGSSPLKYRKSISTGAR
jgi:two-component system response regulator YesN